MAREQVIQPEEESEGTWVGIICQIALICPQFSSPDWADSPWGLIAAVPSEQVVREQSSDREELGEWLCINKTSDRNQDRWWSVTARTCRAANADRWTQDGDVQEKSLVVVPIINNHHCEQVRSWSCYFYFLISFFNLLYCHFLLCLCMIMLLFLTVQFFSWSHVKNALYIKNLTWLDNRRLQLRMSSGFSNNLRVGGWNPAPTKSVVVSLAKTLHSCCLVWMSVDAGC